MKAKNEITFTNETQEKLYDLAYRIEMWRQGKKMSKDQVPVHYSALKSYRNVERILAGDFADMAKLETLEKNLSTLESVWALINAAPVPVPFKAQDNFQLALDLRTAFVRTMSKTGPNRFILMTAPNGRGKTSSLLALQQIYGPKRIRIIEATRVWNGRPKGLLTSIWEALEKTEYLIHGEVGLRMVASALKQQRICLAIDEGHYMEPEQFATIVSLINRSPGEFIVLAQPTLWRRLESASDSYQEIRQLTRNRLACRLAYGDIESKDKDIAKLIDLRLDWLNGHSDEATRLIMKHAAAHGNLALARNVIERTQEAVTDGAEQTFETFQRVLEDELAQR